MSEKLSGTNPDQPVIDAAVKRTVGVAALRRLRKMVEADAMTEAEKIARARMVGILLLSIAAFSMGFLIRLIIRH